MQAEHGRNAQAAIAPSRRSRSAHAQAEAVASIYVGHINSASKSLARNGAVS
jgi:hypothetical protein